MYSCVTRNSTELIHFLINRSDIKAEISTDANIVDYGRTDEIINAETLGLLSKDRKKYNAAMIAEVFGLYKESMQLKFVELGEKRGEQVFIFVCVVTCRQK